MGLMESLLSGLFASLVGVELYVHKRYAIAMDKLQSLVNKKTTAQDAKILIDDKLAPLEVHISEMKDDIKEIKGHLMALLYQKKFGELS